MKARAEHGASCLRGRAVLDLVREEEGKPQCRGVVYTGIRARVLGGGSRRRKGNWCQLPTWQKPCSSQHCKSQSSRWWRGALPGPARPPQPCAGSASRWGGWRMCRSRAWRPAAIRIHPPARNTCSSHPLKSPLPAMRTHPGPTAPHPVLPHGASASSFGSGCVWERRRNTVRAGMFWDTSPSLLPRGACPEYVGRVCCSPRNRGVLLPGTLSSPIGWNG